MLMVMVMVTVPWGFLEFPRSPRTTISVLRRRVNHNRFLRWFMTWAYSSFVFNVSFSAILLWNFVHSGAIPHHEVEKTKWVKVSRSTSMLIVTTLLYILILLVDGLCPCHAGWHPRMSRYPIWLSQMYLCCHWQQLRLDLHILANIF